MSIYSNLKFNYVLFFSFLFFLQSCGKDEDTKKLCNLPLSQQIDNIILSVEKGEEINQVDRNRIYGLASDLNEKYKGNMESDEIIEVID